MATGEGGDEVKTDDIWETDSLLEDILEASNSEDDVTDVQDACTAEEAMVLRKRLRQCGAQLFLSATVGAGIITAKKLCTAFGFRPPAFLDGAPDEAYEQILNMLILRELGRRRKLEHINTIDDVVRLLHQSSNILVITGAGISTSLGIPDFRSKGIGLYSRLEHLGLDDPQEVFDLQLFKEDPTIFYSVARDILPTSDTFSPTHGFIHLLQEREKLLDNFTQNIDNLESKAKIRPENLVQCHGSFATASCVSCKYQVKQAEIDEPLRAGTVPRCPVCLSSVPGSVKGFGLKRKRSSNGSKSLKGRNRWDGDDDDDDEPDELAGARAMKPDITFFGEDLPEVFHDRIQRDIKLADLVIVIGTSLKVAPVSEIPGALPSHVPQVYISREIAPHVDFDVDMIGDCDVVVTELCRRAGWQLRHEMIPEGQTVEVESFEDSSSRYVFRVRSGEATVKEVSSEGQQRKDISPARRIHMDHMDESDETKESEEERKGGEEKMAGGQQ
ncbi:MAG: NAD-dependent histone deacetylase sir2 [Caeruleum heppii]|nr:MAG: NAD-dependent histone deacetylase sir2 [Caeruleum heppii]